MVEIVVRRRGKAIKERKIEFAGKAANLVTVGDLQKKIAQEFKISKERQRLTTEDKKVLDDDAAALSHYGIFTPQDVLYIKDLGPQVSWRTVFVVEYIGPLIIHPIVYYLVAHRIWPETFHYSKIQFIAFLMVMAHFTKRELETVYLHRFSKATMPAFNMIKNSAYYWGLSGVALAFPLYSPWHSRETLRKANDIRTKDEFIYCLVGVWLFAQASNFICHYNVAMLRPVGSKKRVLPRGYGFDLVSFPNYFFEIVGWATFAVLTNEIAAYGFALVGTLQMTAWALKKHRAYRKEFPDMPKSRKAIFPSLL